MEKITKNYKLIIILIVVLAISLRLFYIIKTDTLEYQFDVGGRNLPMDSVEEYDRIYSNYAEEPYLARHIHYIMKLYNEKELPNEVMGQFYHPPLHHAIMAAFLTFMDNFNVGSDIKIESMQILSVIYSCITMWAVYSMLKELEIKPKFRILPMILMAFYPLNIFLSGSINNDMLVLMFSSLALLYTLKWQNNPSMKNAFLLALWIGLGLMTKTSIIVMVIPAVYVYFKMLTQYIKEDKKVGGLLVQLVVFAAVSGVLGLWFQFRSLLNGLNTIGIIQPYENLSVAHYSLWQRFGLSNILFMNGYNLWNYFLYTSLNFGLVYNQTILEGFVALAALMLLLISIYYMIINYKENKMLLLTYISWWISYLYLNISMPYSCSMNSRYMLIPLIIGFVMIGKGLEKEESKMFKVFIYVLTAVICIYSLIRFIAFI